MNKSYKELLEIFKKIKHVNNILAILTWDSSVIMPQGSIEARADQIATLKTVIHETLSSGKVSELINDVNIGSLDNWNTANYRLMQRLYIYHTSISAELTKALAIACSKSEMIWRTAKNENNFKLFAPYLKEVLNLTKQAALSRASAFNCSRYNTLINTYDPGLTENDINPIFDDLRKYLPNFIGQVIEYQKSKSRNDSNTNYNIALPMTLQQHIGLECMNMLGFNFNKGRLDTSEHPFCGGISQDVRITTKYKENDFISGLMATIHETGHGLYEQNLPYNWLDQPVGSVLGMATHESQSLIFEYQICRSKEFIYFLNTLLKEKFKLNSREISYNNLYRSLNIVQPSLIRIDADEVTYPAHIILRYDLERALISGNLKVDDLPEMWNEEMYKFLGIRPTSDKEGCLQDIHWPSGIFGYFPSYLIGAIMAAQLYNTLNKEIPNNLSLISHGQFAHLRNWLTSNIHQYGSKLSLQELLTKATGKALSLNDYKNYLSNKFLQN